MVWWWCGICENEGFPCIKYEHEVLLLSDSEQAGLVCCIIVLAMGFLLEIRLELSLRYY
jgi:hypothetical protein